MPGTAGSGEALRDARGLKDREVHRGFRDLTERRERQVRWADGSGRSSGSDRCDGSTGANRSDRSRRDSDSGRSGGKCHRLGERGESVNELLANLRTAGLLAPNP